MIDLTKTFEPSFDPKNIESSFIRIEFKLWKQILMMTITISRMTNSFWTINIPAGCDGSLQSGISLITGEGGMELDINNDSDSFRPITASHEG